MTAYYNDNDPFSAAWLAALIGEGLIPHGHVDNRSILDVPAADLKGYIQCHFFAGIGGWAYALGLSGWPDNRLVWTGSCPCQPLSSAGQQRGHADERHLWPAFHLLIAQCRPATVFGEQVAGKDGREWLAGIRADLEGTGYAVGAADLCAAGESAPHIRQRLYWVADADQGQRGRLADGEGRERDGPTTGRQQGDGLAQSGGAIVGLADADHKRRREAGRSGGGRGLGRSSASGFWSAYDIVACLDGKARRFEPGSFPLAHGVSNRVGRLRAYGNAIVPQVAAQFITAFMEM